MKFLTGGRLEKSKLSILSISMFIMKLIFTLIFVGLTTLNAKNTYSQNKIDIEIYQGTLQQVFQQIEKNTEFIFFYKDGTLPENDKFTINKKGIELNLFLDDLLKDYSIGYKVDDRQVTVYKKPIENRVKSVPQFTVTGTITDETGLPLSGATVVEKGTTNGTQADFDGNFSIDVAGEDATLVVSFVGYSTQEVLVGGQSEIDIVLNEDTAALDEVVIVGYGVQKKETLTGAVAGVGGEELAQAPVTNISQGVAGRIPGVVAISNGGEPGYDGATLRIRGLSTFGNAAPLVVVDGVPGRSLERIDPSTIKNVSVLKDASAAIYGAQAANGVILVTTKRGKVGAPNIKFSYNHGISRPTVIPEMANAAEYATLLNEVDDYNGIDRRFTQEEIELYRNGSDPWRYPDTDWYEETLKPWSAQTYGNVSINGGTEKMNYFVSLSHRYQDGFYENSATNYNQYDLRTNLDFNINEYLDVYINTTGRFEDRNYPTRSAENIFRMLMRSRPNSHAYWPNGMPGPDIEYGDNPVVISTDATGYSRDKRYVFNSDFGVNLKIPGIEGLTFKGNASIDKNFRFDKDWVTPWYLYTWDQESLDENGNPLLTRGKKGYDDPRLTETMDDSQRILLRGIFDYTKTFGEDHDINLLAGVERITNKGDSFWAYRRYFLSDAIDQLFAGGREEMNNSGSGFEEARLNYFGRVNYAFSEKYLAEFVWRYQGSYIFEESGRFGFFPGVSLGYVISKENFWEDAVPFISFAKLRASWGQTGNDAISPFQYLANYNLNNLLYINNGGNTQSQALYEGVIPNRNVTWETATQKNIGLDLDFLRGDLSLTVDYFHYLREDILWARNASVPNTTGLSLPGENIGRSQNQGFDFNIDYRTNISDLRLNIGLNGVYSKNEILFWDEQQGRPEYQQSTGRPIGAGLYYNAIGIFQTQEEIDNYPSWEGARPGDIIFEDYNDDGVIDGNDRVRYDASRVPTFTGGLNISMNYKNFDLAVLLQGASGGYFYETTESGDFGNYLQSFYEDRWTAENPSTEDPRTYNRNGEYWVNQQNTYWLRKSDYVRLKNIELGYTLPESVTSSILVKNFRVYLSAFNLLTYSPHIDDYDPESTSGSGYNYPLNKVVNVGASINF
ncbi:TonB-dependent receptor [Zunongwangia sp. SCSIO 43204]|uniref:SusC/RagA family TonB-linked outer membrane protein n=1 Tax=Zunongwangia sp. SCSIO 43204 TaxID=2779359 RepID=UPI002107C9B6|nr:TonB-dependent receptor [Zunongwangia sp. SCSIO 43204]